MSETKSEEVNPAQQLATPYEIRLHDGDGLKILDESTSFRFGCCDCGLVHDIKIERHPDGIVLRFYRET